MLLFFKCFYGTVFNNLLLIEVNYGNFLKIAIIIFKRCNDVLELVQTMRHFQILSKTVSIGGSDNQNMDILAQEIHAKYIKALNEFQHNVSDVMSFDNQAKNFEISFYHLRTTIKVFFLLTFFT